MSNWNLRKDLLALSHRWYWIAIASVLGALLGWSASYLIPSPYRASMDLYVGLDGFRASEDQYISAVAQEQFRNLDDYKNWQMQQLETLIFSDEYLSETLSRLREADDHWDSISSETLRAGLSTSWRNAGVWYLSAEFDNAGMAEMSVKVWGDMIVNKVNTAVEHALEVRVLDDQLTSIAKTEVNLRQREIILKEVFAFLNEWQDELTLMDADQPVGSADAWAIAALVATASDWNPGWIAVLEHEPTPENHPEAYITWLDQVLPLLELELKLIPGQMDGLNADRESLRQAYAEETKESQALSANLVVYRPSESEPQLAPIRQTGLLILIGGFLGILVWLLWFLARASRKGDV